MNEACRRERERTIKDKEREKKVRDEKGNGKCTTLDG